MYIDKNESCVEWKRKKLLPSVDENMNWTLMIVFSCESEIGSESQGTRGQGKIITFIKRNYLEIIKH